MPVAFNTLKEKATTQQLQSVMHYIQGTWFDSTVWPVTAWSVFGKSVRTNNDVEGCQHPRTEGQLTVLPPDQTYIQGSIQDTATTEDDLWRQTTSPTTKTDQDGTVSGTSCSYGTTTPTTRLQLVIYWRSVAAFILPVCRVFSDIVWIWMNRCIYMCWCYDNDISMCIFHIMLNLNFYIISSLIKYLR